ncbi:hypothetical protein MUK42_25107 [Musa troglodytarum]|uniref:RING-CH-type domain-containing protein n=1 Tax=Musa troglodytarum TaxID=320322 RepID=A0A9E7IC73_9LILI|nr:hypothetical protein MUK42_25107 [Musa troglodytarum]
MHRHLFLRSRLFAISLPSARIIIQIPPSTSSSPSLLLPVILLHMFLVFLGLCCLRRKEKERGKAIETGSKAAIPPTPFYPELVGSSPSRCSSSFVDSAAVKSVPYPLIDSETMGDHLALVVDDLLTKPTLEAAAGNRKHAYVDANTTSSSSADPAASAKLKECRICHEEDQDSNMEIPCSCRGSLKYAHRVCVQRWCNQKGDTMCEICLQQFNPGYTTLPKLYDYGSTLRNFSWEISAQDLRDTQFITMFPSDHGAIDSAAGYRDYSRTSSTFYCRSITFMVLLVVRHALPLLISEDDQYSFTLFSVSLRYHPIDSFSSSK